MKSRLLLVVKLAFVALLCVLVYVHKAHKPRILIVHSYLDDYSWVQEINTGLKRFFDGREDVTLRYHYMDLKNHTGEGFQRTSAEIARRTIERWQPNILIIFDDIAQKLVGMHYLDDPDIGIVYGGVNGDEEDYGYDRASNATGILERKPLPAVEETLAMIWRASGGDPERKPVVQLIGDGSFSFRAGLRAYESYDFTQVQWLPPISVDTYGDWQEKVRKADREADILLVSDYRQLRREKGGKEFVPGREVMTWTEENSRVPVLGLAAIVTEEGGMMSVAASGYEQGEVAGRMAYAMVQGKPAADIPSTKTEQYLISLRKSAIERRKLQVPSIYEAFARATANFFE